MKYKVGQRIRSIRGSYTYPQEFGTITSIKYDNYEVLWDDQEEPYYCSDFSLEYFHEPILMCSPQIGLPNAI